MGKGAAICLSIFLANGADLASTEYALRQGAQEANPLLRHPAARYPIKAAGSVAECAVLLRVRRRKPTLAKVLLGVIVAGNVALAVHNVRVGQQSAARP